jgi:RNA polymerase sigma-70 factor (ECF subfamily)
MKIWSVMQKGEHPDNIKAFLYTSVRNAVTDWYRKKKPLSLDGLQEVGFDVEVQEESYADKFDVEKLLEKNNDLEEMYREIIILRFVNDLSVKEIAKLLNERENNISVRIHRAVDKLKKSYKN